MCKSENENVELISDELEALLAIYSDSDILTIASQKNVILYFDKKRNFSIDFWLPPGYPTQEPLTYRQNKKMDEILDILLPLINFFVQLRKFFSLFLFNECT